ncbi:uncharacterized protein LOC105164928 isoform X2 [Sesamum indicum]|uniref:Uncharacterized protein LOC105164928 isoform X2 n=1 Tax=Sesamum indicum TaxID=4182 RepID=A0A8M8USN3_SESIN|nr:uncharacterized protein LOC105164928 isoform X2 [Sesamum indicum]
MRRELSKSYDGKSKSIWYLAEKGPRELKLDKGEYAVNKLQRFILSHIWNTSKKSAAPYGGSGVAHLISMPSLPLLITSRSATGAETNILKENESSHKPEDKRVSKIKFLLAGRKRKRLLARRLGISMPRIRQLDSQLTSHCTITTMSQATYHGWLRISGEDNAGDQNGKESCTILILFSGILYVAVKAVRLADCGKPNPLPKHS